MAFTRSGVRFPSPPILKMDNNGIDKENVFSGDVDPEIADLFGIKEDDGPSFNLLFNEGAAEEDNSEQKEEIDFSKKSFSAISKLFEDKPAPFFRDKSYYKTALSGEGEESQRFHKILSQYLNIENPKERSAMRV